MRDKINYQWTIAILATAIGILFASTVILNNQLLETRETNDVINNEFDEVSNKLEGCKKDIKLLEEFFLVLGEKYGEDELLSIFSNITTQFVEIYRDEWRY